MKGCHKAKSINGFTLIELMISTALSISSIAGAFILVEIGSNVLDKQNVRGRMLEKRKELFELINDAQVVAQTKTHMANAGAFNCVNDPNVECDPNSNFIEINLYDSTGSLVLETLNQKVGFNETFDSNCTTFGAQASANQDLCAYRVTLSWKPVCSIPCRTSNAMFRVDFIQSEHTKTQINSEDFSLYTYVNLNPATLPVRELFGVRDANFLVDDSGALLGIGTNNASGASIMRSTLGIGNNRRNVTFLEPVLDETGTPITNPIDIGEHGSRHSCLITSTNDLKCSGYNSDGDLGTGNYTHSTSFIPALFSAGNPAIGFEWVQHQKHGGNIARSTTGDYYFWGGNKYNRYAMTGFTFAGPDFDSGMKLSYVQTSPLIQAQPLIRGSRSIALAGSSACAIIDTDDSVTCWGQIGMGLMGDGELNLSGDIPSTGLSISLPSQNTNRRVQLSNAPNPTVRLTNVVEIAATEYTFCAIVGGAFNNRVACWGDASKGVTGDNSTSTNRTAEFVVDSLGNPLENVTQLSLAYEHACAVVGTNSSEMHCWGENESGQLGAGYASIKVDVATRALGITKPITKIILGFQSTCIMFDDLTASCVGKNNSNKFNGGQMNTTSLTWVEGF